MWKLPIGPSWDTIKSCSRNVLAIEANYKVLTQWYLGPVRIARFVPGYPLICFQGCGQLGSFFSYMVDLPTGSEILVSSLLNLD